MPASASASSTALLDVLAQLVLGHLALDQVLAELAHRLALCGVS